MPEHALLMLSQCKELSYIASGHVRLVRTGSELLSQPGGIIAHAKMTGGWNASREKKGRNNITFWSVRCYKKVKHGNAEPQVCEESCAKRRIHRNTLQVWGSQPDLNKNTGSNLTYNCFSVQYICSSLIQLRFNNCLLYWSNKDSAAFTCFAWLLPPQS